jgi:hypothetical protein
VPGAQNSDITMTDGRMSPPAQKGRRRCALEDAPATAADWDEVEDETDHEEDDANPKGES